MASRVGNADPNCSKPAVFGRKWDRPELVASSYRLISLPRSLACAFWSHGKHGFVPISSSAQLPFVLRIGDSRQCALRRVALLSLVRVPCLSNQFRGQSLTPYSCGRGERCANAG
jgi:hypothetical protein